MIEPLLRQADYYSVLAIHGCRVVQGAVPVPDLVALINVWAGSRDDATAPEDEWVMDGKLAEALGAMMVCGSRRDTLAYRARLNIENKEQA